MFFGENVNNLLNLVGSETFSILQITLPIGISFYTFQSMSYTIDLYRGRAPAVRSFTDLACFVSLFPQLIAGPIVRYRTIAAQLVRRTYNWERLASGASLFILGFSKKILLANPIGAIADAVFWAESAGALEAWLGVTAYAFQIYFDFSGYSDMALGLGRILGFDFPKNFASPYRAESITDFWRRWHISLLHVPAGLPVHPTGWKSEGPLPHLRQSDDRHAGRGALARSRLDLSGGGGRTTEPCWVWRDGTARAVSMHSCRFPPERVRPSYWSSSRGSSFAPQISVRRETISAACSAFMLNRLQRRCSRPRSLLRPMFSSLPSQACSPSAPPRPSRGPAVFPGRKSWPCYAFSWAP